MEAMARPSESEGNWHESVTFETIIDEDEAQSELGELPLTDDELFVDLEFPEARDAEKNMSVSCPGAGPDPGPASRARTFGSSTTCTKSTSLTSGPTSLECDRCHRIYKRRHFLEKHKETCTGAGRQAFKLKAATEPTESEYSTSSQVCHEPTAIFSLYLIL